MMKNKKKNLTKEEKIAMDFVKTAMKNSKKMGVKMVGIRKA